jgi:hypothetical protein
VLDKPIRDLDPVGPSVAVAGLKWLAKARIAQVEPADELRVIVLDHHGIVGQVTPAAADAVKTVVEYGYFDRFNGTASGCDQLSYRNEVNPTNA